MPPNRSSGKKSVVVGVTGASGAVFARRTLQMLEADQRVDKIHLVVSGSGMKLLRDELDLEVSRAPRFPRGSWGSPPGRPSTFSIRISEPALPAGLILWTGWSSSRARRDAWD